MSFDILRQTNYISVVFLLFRLFFQLLHLFLFWFGSIFHLYLPLLPIGYCVHLLLPPWWNLLLLLSIPISHFFSSLFLVFSLLLIFSLILALTKKGLILFQYLFCQPICDLSGYILCCQVISRSPCERPNVDTMFLSQLNLFPEQNLPLHYHLFCCEGCALLMLDINSTCF